MLVVVLNDGETYTDLDGCVVLEVPDSFEGDEVDEYVKACYDEGSPIANLLEW